jgi:hypothetical protein
MLVVLTVNFILAFIIYIGWHLLMAIPCSSTDFKDGMLIENPVKSGFKLGQVPAADGNPHQVLIMTLT